MIRTIAPYTRMVDRFFLPVLVFFFIFSGSILGAASGKNYSKSNPGCLECHGKIEDIHTKISIACTDCHGGDYTTARKERAHVLPTMPVIMDKTTPPLDYDLPYQRFVNPSNLRVVEETCGNCHMPHVGQVKKSLMATGAGHNSGGLYQNNVIDTKTPVYGYFSVIDKDGEVPVERGAVTELLDLVEYDPSLDQSEFATHYRAVPGQVCARCHLWSRGKGFRGAENADGTYRADGCAACHMIYGHDGRSQSADPTIDHTQQGHPLIHQTTKAIPSEQCVRCHHRGARIGLSFQGKAQMPPDLPSGPGVKGTTDIRFNGNYHYADPKTNPMDIHSERGLHCIDCHTKAGIMGDDNIYGHMDQATKVECRTCHGVPWHKGQLIDFDGKHLNNVHAENDGSRILTSKVDGVEHRIPQVTEIVNPESPHFNPKAAAAMNENHLKEEGGLECYSCHTSWIPNCFGCHFERDETKIGIDLITRKEEIGKASTGNKVFESFKHFSMGMNSQGKVSPFMVGCHPIADVTAPDGSKKLDFVMPETVNGKSGLAHNPVHPHTIRSVGEVLTCEECHRSPPSLGLGSGNYSLAQDYAFVITADGVQLFDRWKDPGNPVKIATIPVDSPLALASKSNIVTGRADFLYVAAGDGGLSVFDLTGDVPVTPISQLNGINAIDVSRVARYVYVVDAGVGIRVYDNQTPATLELVATVAMPAARRAVPWGVDLFVASGREGLVVVDIADHKTPRIRGTLTGINAQDLVLYAHHQKGNAFAARAYVADPGYGIRIVDLLPEFSDPKLAGGLPLPGISGLDTYSRYVLADELNPSREHDYLYAAAGDNGLHIFDITEPDAVEEVAVLKNLNGSVMDVDVCSQIDPPGTNDYALLANSELGLQVVDVTDPLNPELISNSAAPNASRILVEVMQLDRYVDEQGNELKENSHPGGAAPLNHGDVVRILRADISAGSKAGSK